MIEVIIPAYNAERFLPTCLASLTDGDTSGAEFILVDDGSTDGTGAICDAFGAERANARAIHRENGGSPAARNAGVAAAGNPRPGQWVWFVDSDDLVAPGALARLSELAAGTDADAVYFCCVSFPAEGEPDWGATSNGERRTLSGREFLSGTYRFELDHYLWRFLFRREALERLVAWREKHGMTQLCDEGYSLLEDLVFVEEAMQGACRSVEVVPDVLYGYRQSAQSMAHRASPKAADSAFRAVRYIDRFEVPDEDELPKQLMQMALLFNAYSRAGQGAEERDLRAKIRGEIERRVREVGLRRLPWRLAVRYLALRSGVGDAVLRKRERETRSESKC